MKPQEYEQAVLRTCAVEQREQRLLLAALGMGDELGEIFPLVRDRIFQRWPPYATKAYQTKMNELIAECGDFLWYLALAHQALEISLEVSVANSPEAWRRRHDLARSGELADPYAILLETLAALSTFTSQVKKHLFHTHPLDEKECQEAISDATSFFSVLLEKLSLEFEQVARVNVEKLEHRYPNGFDSARSLNREDEEVVVG